MSVREESIRDRLRVLLGHYYCPDCFQVICTDKCGRRHQKEIDEISEVIGKEKYDDARKLIDALELKVGYNGYDDPEIIRLQTIMAFLEGDDEYAESCRNQDEVNKNAS